MKNNILFLPFLLVFSLLLATSCSQDSKDDKTPLLALLATSSSSSASVTVPKLVPIIQESLPTALKNTAYGSSVRALSDVTTIQDRLFKQGPADFRFRLSKVDEEITSLTTTQAAVYGSCFTSTGATWAPSTFTSGGITFEFPMAISCRNIKSSDATTYMGADATSYYIANLTKNVGTDSIYVLAKIAKTGNTVEIYQLGVANSGPTSILHIISDKSTQDFNISTASSSDATGSGVTFTGVGCGMQLRTNSTFAYFSGKAAQQASCPATTTQCADASQGTTLTASTSCPTSIQTFTSKAFTQAILSDSTVKTALTNIGNAAGMPASVVTR